MKKVINILSFLKNKYLLAFAAFAILMLFVDHNDIFIQLQRKKDLMELHTINKFYQNEIAKTKEELANLQSNSAAIEAYARENFLMKRDNEDLFIVQTRKTNTEKAIKAQ